MYPANEREGEVETGEEQRAIILWLHVRSSIQWVLYSPFERQDDDSVYALQVTKIR